MSAPAPVSGGSAVFLSYASQDAEAAARICEALRAAGVEVWFDQQELTGGDAWDQKIRGQIKTCTLFIPIISAATNARREGYFRREWKLAVDRTHDMDEALPFLLPVVIDATTDAGAFVPEKFREVQWTRIDSADSLNAFCERVKTLLGGEVGARASSPATATKAGGTPALPTDQPAGRVLLARFGWAIGIAAAVLLGVFGWSRLQQEPDASSSSDPAARRSAPATTKSMAPISEARQLVAKAWEQLNKPELARADLEVAEGLCQRAAELDANHAEVWAAWSQVDSWYAYHNFDRSPARQEGARTKAARAIQLAPDSHEARLAQACQLVRAGGGHSASLFDAETVELLRALLRENQDEPRALWALGILLRNSRKFAETREVFGRLVKNPAFAATGWNELGWAEISFGDFGAAEAAGDKSIALRPYWGNLALKAYIAQTWWGDLDLAKTTMDRIPAVSRQEDFGISISVSLHYWRREPDAMLQVLGRVPRDWLQTNGFDGPKAYWAALAHRMAGRGEAARVQWQTALKLVERRLADSPDSAELIRWKGVLLAELGNLPEAETALRLAREMGSTGSTDLASDEILLGNLGAAMTVLEREVDERARRRPAAYYRLHPTFDPLRQDPRFQALLAKMEADPSRSPKAKPAAVTVAPAQPPVADAKSVAVLAFTNLSDDKGNEYFSDGISEELLNVLGKVPGLKVTAGTSSFSFKGKSVAVPEMARQLGVAYVVEGSVRKAGSQVRITAKLIKAADGFHVWGDTFTRDLKDVFAVQDEIAGLIAKNLSLKLGATSAASKAAVNPQAFELYLLARQAWNRRTSAGFAEAESLLTQALALEPKFARAHAALADVWGTRLARLQEESGAEPPHKSAEIARVRARIDLALTHDPDSAEAYTSLGGVLQWAGYAAEAAQAFRRAVELNPNFAWAHHWFSSALVRQGKMDEALEHSKRAAELDPLSPAIWGNTGNLLIWAGRPSEGIAAYDRALAVQPSFVDALRGKIHALVALGRFTEAGALMSRLPKDEDRTAAVQFFVHASAGRKAEAEALLADPRFQARFYAENLGGLLVLGRTEAVLSLVTALPIGLFPHAVFLFHPLIDPLRNDPRWVKFIADAGLTEAHARAQAWRKANPPEKP